MTPVSELNDDILEFAFLFDHSRIIPEDRVNMSARELMAKVNLVALTVKHHL